MDRQATLNKVWASLKEQGRPGWDSELGQCTYKDCGGNKCAVGFLLPEQGGWWGSNDDINGLLENYPVLYEALAIEEGDEDFLSDLQQAHDNAAENISYIAWTTFDGFIEELARHYAKIAHHYGLEFEG